MAAVKKIYCLQQGLSVAEVGLPKWLSGDGFLTWFLMAAEGRTPSSPHNEWEETEDPNLKMKRYLKSLHNIIPVTPIDTDCHCIDSKRKYLQGPALVSKQDKEVWAQS